MAWEEKPMSRFALVTLRRASVFAFGLLLLFVARVKDDPNRVLVAAEPVGHARIAHAKLPLSFEPNLGQADPRVKFLSRGPGYTLFLAEDEAVVALRKSGAGRQDSGSRIQDSGFRRRKSEQERRPWSVVRGQLQETTEGIRNASLVRTHLSLQFPAPSPQPSSFLCLKLLRANPAAKVIGVNELPGKSNYLTGNDPKKWRTNVPTYGRVQYENIYPGVDLVYYGKKGGQLEYDFVVAPGADPGAIALAIDAGGQVSSKQKAAGSSQPSVVGGSRRAGSVATANAARTTDSTPSKIQIPKSKISSSLRMPANRDLIVTAECEEEPFNKPVVYQAKSRVESQESRVESRQRTTDHGQ